MGHWSVKKIRLLLFTLVFCACSHTNDTLKMAEHMVETAPDSALAVLHHLPPTSYKSGQNRALYGLLMIEILDRKKLPLKPDSLLDYSLNYYLNNKDGNKLASCYLYKGRAFNNNFQYEQAITCYLKALDVIEHNDYLLLGRINSDLGDIYVVQREYIQARQKYYIAYKYFSVAKHSNFASYSYLDIGKTYCSTKEYSKAQKYFHQVYAKTKDSLTSGAAIDEIGLCFYNSNQNDSALHYFRKVINYPSIGSNRAIRYYYLASVFFDIKEIDSAYIYATKTFQYNPDIRTQRECYRILANSEYLKGNTTQMSFYSNQYVKLSDSLRKIDNQTKGSYMESMHSAKQEAVKSTGKFWYTVAFLLFVILSTIAIYFVKHRKNKEERLLVEESHLKQKVGIRKEVISKYSETLLQKIEALKAKQAAERKKTNHTGKEVLDRKIYEELLQMNKPDLFFCEMDTVLNNLVTKLKTSYPTLTAKEISWCCLTLLNIPTADIYLLLDYTVDGLKSMRKRLAQKANLSGVSELTTFLDKILSE